jgi:hypothetical protein
MSDPAKVEVLKVWYSVFCTLVDDHLEAGGYGDRVVFIDKMLKLRQELSKAIPEVEAEMARHKQ